MGLDAHVCCTCFRDGNLKTPPLSIGESSGHERRDASVTIFSYGDSGTPSISVQATNLWYDGS